ncbi:MAG: hypothetical protein JNK85_15790 [Verrucomicrobiales bacterium]|nr:hypothetical protein [Verrucomicrobiales bacterium]
MNSRLQTPSIAVLLLITALASASEAIIPESDDVILVRLPPSTALTRPSSAVLHPILSEAMPTAREWVRVARHEGDPRLLGRAQALLQPWWSGTDVPVDALLLRAEIKQGLHAFEAALQDVDAALRREPRHGGAWLLKVTLHQVMGSYTNAQNACLQLARHADALTATTAAASLRSLWDSSSSPGQALATAIQQHSQAPGEVRAWAWTSLGEIHARNGEAVEAERSFQAALELQPKAPYTVTALADLWIATGQFPRVADFLRDATSDPLRLRLAEALVRIDPEAPATRSLVASLADAFALGQIRGDDLHLREFARFVLRIQRQPALAVALARKNWSIQREPADLDLLFESAEAARDTETLAQANQWVEQYRLRVGWQTKTRGTHLQSSNTIVP